VALSPIDFVNQYFVVANNLGSICAGDERLRVVPGFKKQSRHRVSKAKVTLDEAAVALNISAATVRRIINEGLLPASQLCKGAPWVIRTDNLAGADIRRAADARRTRRPASRDPR
jgi:hypothetical protein